MSFAQGFQAGSAAVTRGLQLRDQREEKERQKRYRDDIAALNEEYRLTNEAQNDYEAQLAAQPQMSPVPQQPGAAGLMATMSGQPQQPPPQMSPVPQQPSVIPSSLAAPVTAPPPSAMSPDDYTRRASQIAMQAGDVSTGVGLMNQLRLSEATDKSYSLAKERLDNQDRQFKERLDTLDRQFEETLGFNREKWEDGEEEREQQVNLLNTQIENLSLQVDQARQDANNARAADAGRNAFSSIYFDDNFSIENTVDNLRQSFTDENDVLDEQGFNIAVGAAGDMYYKDYLKVDPAVAARVQASALNQLDAAITAGADQKVSDNEFIDFFGSALKEHVDPNFSDNIATELVAIKDAKGKNTGQFELRHGGVRVANAPRFNSREEVIQFAQQERDRLANSPYAVIEITENRKKVAAAAAAGLKDYKEREAAFFDFLEKNPHLRERQMEIKQLFRLKSGLSTDGTNFGDGGGSGGNTQPVSPGLAALQANRTAENEAESARNTARNTARQIVSMARNADELAQARELETPEVQAFIDQMSRAKGQANQALLRSQINRPYMRAFTQ